MNLNELRDTWNELGRRDAMWAVLTGPREAERQWDRDAFFRTGVEEVATVLARAESLGASPRRDRALDFGCGIGRLSQALAGHFQEVHGVDIASAMLEQARQLNTAGTRCQFHLNERDTLALFDDARFDFVYSCITLQHMEPQYSRRFLSEFFRVTRPGGVVVFQIPGEQTPVAPSPGAPRSAASAGPLAPDACRAEIIAPAQFTCAPGARVRLPVRVKNVGAAPWPARGEADGGRSVRLANRWRHRFGWMVRADDVRAALHDDLGPGEDVVLDLVFDAPDHGVHTMELDMVQEHVTWFGAHGSPVARIRVTVDRSLPPGTVTGIPRRMEMYGIPRDEVAALVTSSGAVLLAADPDDAPGPGWTSYRYYARRLG